MIHKSSIQKRLILAGIMAPLLFAGCGSSPDSKFYTLNAISRAEVETLRAVNQGPVSVKVGPVTIPESLDQSRIVTRSGRNVLDIAEYHRWGGDLLSGIQRILGENISILLPTDQIILNQEISFRPAEFQVIVNIREFSGELGGAVTLNADWSVVKHGKDKRVAAKKSILHNTASVGFPGYVEAQTKLLSELSHEIVAEINCQMNRK